MPIREYRCERCGHELELLQKMSAARLTECPECGAEQGLKPLISKTSFKLKGSGWYVTDYKKAGDNGRSDKKASSEGSSDTGDSKPDKSSSSGDSASSSSSSSSGDSSSKPSGTGSTPSPASSSPKSTSSSSD